MIAVHSGTAHEAHSGSSAARSDIAAVLWNSSVPSEGFADDCTHRYRASVLEQYKVYVESADRASARRSTANTFFLTMNGLLLTVFGAAATSQTHAPVSSVVCVAIAALCQCLVWWMYVISFRKLASAKWAVVAELELRLPALAFSSAEWGTALPGRRYMPLTTMEQWVPAVFAALHVATACTLLIR
ncbi:RipA family octameric membrane protein [Streptomyces sp. NPDC003343]